MVDPATAAVAFAVGALATLVAVRGSGRPITHTERETAHMATCDVCERRYSSVTDAIDHAREAHNAPGSDDDVRELLTLRGDA